MTNFEIILSAGVIGSPHILLLSGIGPRKQLDAFGIQLIHESNLVGKNLKDQIGLFVRYQMNESLGLDLENVLTLSGQIKSVLKYYLLGTGIERWSVKKICLNVFSRSFGYIAD